MSGVSIRRNQVPSGVILLTDVDSIPNGYNLITTYDEKYIKQVPDSLTDPGSNVGTASHQHDSVGSHDHTVSGAHTHTGNTTGTSSQGNISCATPLDCSGPHSHGFTSDSTTPATTTINSTGAHQHDIQNNDPLFRTYKLIKKNSSHSIRKKSIPFNSLILWPKSISLIPSNFSQDQNIFTRLVKISSTVGTSDGRSTHLHSSVPHSHTVDMANHTHNISAVLAGNVPGAGGTATTDIEAVGHTHALGSPSVGAATPSFSTQPGGDHAHDSLSIIPSSKETSLLKISTISIRKSGVLIGSILLWEDPLSDIPFGFALADGTGGTVNYSDKYVLGVPDGVTDPGTDTGNHTHQHLAASSHDHGVDTRNHTHTVSGGVGDVSALADRSTPGACEVSASQAHNYQNMSGSNIVQSSFNDVHQHNSLDHKPVSKEIALIQKL